MTDQKAKSPYQRYGKTPHRYSALYQQWSRAMREGKEAEARRIGRQHSREFLGCDPQDPA